ncbi:MAG: prolyl oligopeptidase family serine peptidase [Woeseiaceae bacterium]|nr:prolyl oligopeptidase family serine peptidase [Woeseiaceae bacterium]
MTRDGSNPLLQYGYGSYGATIDPDFDPDLLSLLDRGFIYAVAHVRGGSKLGTDWYYDGRQLQKKNTFFDFIDVSRYLIDEGYTSPEHLYARGGSAGGLLMGAVVDMAPELYNGVAAAVPFVDVVTTMLDDSIPLDGGRMGRVGRSAQAGLLRLHSVLLAVRQRERTGLPAHAGHDRPARLPGAVLGTGEMGRQAARSQDGRQPAVAEDRHAGGAQRQDGALPEARGYGALLHVRALAGRHTRMNPGTRPEGYMSMLQTARIAAFCCLSTALPAAGATLDEISNFRRVLG